MPCGPPGHVLRLPGRACCLPPGPLPRWWARGAAVVVAVVVTQGGALGWAEPRPRTRSRPGPSRSSPGLGTGQSWALGCHRPRGWGASGKGAKGCSSGDMKRQWRGPGNQRAVTVGANRAIMMGAVVAVAASARQSPPRCPALVWALGAPPPVTAAATVVTVLFPAGSRLVFKVKLKVQQLQAQVLALAAPRAPVAVPRAAPRTPLAAV